MIMTNKRVLDMVVIFLECKRVEHQKKLDGRDGKTQWLVKEVGSLDQQEVVLVM